MRVFYRNFHNVMCTAHSEIPWNHTNNSCFDEMLTVKAAPFYFHLWMGFYESFHKPVLVLPFILPKWSLFICLIKSGWSIKMMLVLVFDLIIYVFAFVFCFSAFFPLLVILHFIQLFFYSILISKPWFISTLFGNTLWL